MNANSSLPKPETIGAWLKSTTHRLETAGVGTARLDSLILLEDALGKDRSWLLAHPETYFQGQTMEILEKQIKRRMNHEPLAYIRGKTEFYGREFIIDKTVLEPRPESETMIDQLKLLYKNGPACHAGTAGRPCTVVDVGTGSGALAITAKLELPDADVHAIDIDPKCLKVARKNAKKHCVDMHFHKGNLLAPILKSDIRNLTSILLANLPYVPDSYQINEAAAIEPRIAIFGGPDGLDLYRRLFDQLSDARSAYVLTESLPFQHAKLQAIAKRADYRLVQTDDFIQVFEKV